MANVLQNPDFNSGLTGWTVASGTFAIDAVEGLPAQPSLHAISAPPSGYEAFVNSPCIQMRAPQSVDLSANIKHVSGTAAEVDVYGFTDTACTNFLNVVALVSTPQIGIWSAGSSTNVALPDGTRSVMVQLVAGSSSPSDSVDAYFDHILFGPTGTPVPAAVSTLSMCGLLLLVLCVALSANYSFKRTAAGRLR